MRELVSSKSAVEEGVHSVLRDNEQLAQEVDALTAEVDKLKRGGVKLGASLASTKTDSSFASGHSLTLGGGDGGGAL